MPRQQVKALVDESANCDICKKGLFTGVWFYDGATKIGPWAWMCQDCFPQYGMGLGIGRGQCYDSETKVKQVRV